MSEKISQKEANRRACQKFHDEHPEVWRLFVKFTFQKIGQSFKNFGARAVWERVRWETPMGADGKTQFKVNDHYHTFYARRFMSMYPEHKGFFRLRVQTSAFRPARGTPDFSPEDVDA